jgi:hypothetical protein
MRMDMGALVLTEETEKHIVCLGCFLTEIPANFLFVISVIDLIAFALSIYSWGLTSIT